MRAADEHELITKPNSAALANSGSAPTGDGPSQPALPAILPDGEQLVIFEGVPIIRRVDPSSHGSDKGNLSMCHVLSCDYCGDSSGDLFQPCHCPGPRLFHRDCFRRWRTGWITPRNYYSCPDCGSRYNIERVVPSGRINTETKRRIMRHFRCRIAIFYLTVVLGLTALVGGIAGIAYGCDTSDKNVPVAMKYMLSGAFSGLPPDNATSVWRAQFKQPDVAVWPYYTLLGALCASLAILIAFAVLGCTFDETERPRRPCVTHCACPHAQSDVVYCGGPCRCDGCCVCDSNCSGGSCPRDCNGARGAEELFLLVLVLILVAIIVSALITVVGYTLSKVALFHDRMTEMMLHQAEELEAETVVLGVNEVLRPTDAV